MSHKYAHSSKRRRLETPALRAAANVAADFPPPVYPVIRASSGGVALLVASHQLLAVVCVAAPEQPAEDGREQQQEGARGRQQRRWQGPAGRGAFMGDCAVMERTAHACLDSWMRTTRSRSSRTVRRGPRAWRRVVSWRHVAVANPMDLRLALGCQRRFIWEGGVVCFWAK